MKNIIEKLQSNRKLYKTSYDVTFRMEAMLGALIASAILFIPVLIVNIELYYLFLMRPYLIITTTFLSFSVIVFLYFLFKINILKRIKKVDGLNYFLIALDGFILSFMIMLIIYLIAMIFIVKKFII